MTDYKQYNLKEFKLFIQKILDKKYKGKLIYSEIKDKIDVILKNETSRLSALSFFKTLLVINEDLDKSCKVFFKGHPAFILNTLQQNSNKLDNLFSPLLNSKAELSKACAIKETRLSELFQKRFDQLYAYEAFGLSIAVGIKPSQLFKYFYGDGERPVIGLIPKPADGDASEG